MVFGEGLFGNGEERGGGGGGGGGVGGVGGGGGECSSMGIPLTASHYVVFTLRREMSWCSMIILIPGSENGHTAG